MKDPYKKDEGDYKLCFYSAIGFIVMILIMFFTSCTKPDTRIEMSFIGTFYSGCNPPQYNTAIVSLNGLEYTFNLERTDNAYRSTNTILIEPGAYEVELKYLEGMKTYKRTGDLNGAVVIPGSYRTDYYEDSNIQFQPFC